MAEYNHQRIEKKWKKFWAENETYKVVEDQNKPKFYVLDMFPYPSGSGLHVGHPLGYIASDIYSRYKRQSGYQVLHPMGFDAFGLPAEQYAIQTGVHPAKSTKENIQRYISQLENLGLDYDWSRKVITCDPNYYKWTQWIFLKLFDAWYDRNEKRAKPISDLIKIFETDGNANHPCPGDENIVFSSKEWNEMTDEHKSNVIMHYRLAYSGFGEVNWCEALGTVLANDEVVNGVSERGGYPVVKKTLRQWYLRITEYADRLLEGLQHVDFSDAMKEMQTNWIGKSVGAQISFDVKDSIEKIHVFTTRPDTIFGVDFMVLAPEHPLLATITTSKFKHQVSQYISFVKSRNERERMAEKKITGVFTGAYALHPFTGKEIPIWTSEYVLYGYGTGAIMAVPCGDERDHRFAKHFNIPITNILGDHYDGETANPAKNIPLTNSSFLNELLPEQASVKVIEELEKIKKGVKKVNYKMRDAAFSRQRYWGEPFPIKWVNGLATPLSESELPLELPHVESYGPGPEGEGPLANIAEWKSQNLETNTMPGYAGSSWYFLRYMDPDNKNEFCSRSKSDYWNQVDLYVGGTEHAVGHLLYSRLWTKVLYDLGYIGFDEPFKKLVNQGMILGNSRFVYRIRGTNTLVSSGLKDQYQTDPIHVDVNLVDGLVLNIEAYKKITNEPVEFILENGQYICGAEIEKMSKSKLNTVTPDDIVEKYGADVFRMYEMFLGPIEQSKPWDTKGIEGVNKFIRKYWQLVHDDNGNFVISEEKPTKAEYKAIHTLLKKLNTDLERMSMNTCVSAFMICVNELKNLSCNKREIITALTAALAPFAPFVTEEVWSLLGFSGSVHHSEYPKYDEHYLQEDEIIYPLCVNGKKRSEIAVPNKASKREIENIALSDSDVSKWIAGKTINKIIIVPGKMVNIVVA